MNPEPLETSALPADPESRARLYHLLAGRLLAEGSGAAVLFEWRSGRTVPRLWSRPRHLLAGLGADTVRTPPGSLPGVKVERNSTTSRTVLRELVAMPRVDRGVPYPLAREVPAAPSLLGPLGELRTQTFWTAGRSDGRLWTARRSAVLLRPRTELPLSLARIEAAIASEWSARVGLPIEAIPSARSAGFEWATGSSRSVPRAAWFGLSPAEAERTAEPLLLAPSHRPEPTGHTLAFGATGAGKTWFLADTAARALRRGARLFAIDLHGDLGPAIAARLPPEERPRLIGVDLCDRPIPGISALRGSDDRAAGHLVAAVKRLSPDGAEIYWGFRIERIFDAFVRLVLESGGTLLDLYGLLTEADQREVARLSTHRPELSRFLDELAPIVRRTPDFLWPAAARLSKVALVPALAELLAPRDGGLDVERLLTEGRSVVVRVPFSVVGAEAATFAGSLLLARVYYGMASAPAPTGRATTVLAVLDEAHGF